MDVSRIAAEILISLIPVLPGSDVDPPRMIALDAETLQARACGRPCKVMAWYAPEGTIYIDNRLDVANYMGDRSIVVHELVHHVQRMSRGERAKNCNEWAQREQEAYAAQAFWLRSRGLRPGNITLQARFLRCSERVDTRQPASSERHPEQVTLSTHSDETR